MFRLKNLSKDFITKIIDHSAGKVPQNVLEDFLAFLENEISQCYFTNSSESNLLRIIQYQFDISFFIKECLKYPQHIEILVAVSNSSNYLSDILVRNPEYFFWIVNSSVLNQNIDEKYYSALLKNSLSSFKSFEAKLNVIRNFKRKELLRIGLKDIYLKADLNLITNYLSKLAVAISSELFALCYKEILNKYKLEKVRNRYVLFSLGKLGGNELNYSSDIDLIAFYDKNTFIKNKIYYNQILSEAILLFIETASKKTGSGFLYRVDFRLRPDGRNAPLCGSYAEYLRYYETRGEDWERQMLIKANFLCGSKLLFNKFYSYVSKFIYPTSFSIPPTQQIKKLKSSIEKRNNVDSNIKLTAGGIRDIEFSLQALQLINGGKNLSLRTGNSLQAIKKMEVESIITNDESDILKKSYQLYRRIEHYLQLMNDQQTHTIPEEGELAEKLSHFLGFNNLQSFKQQLKHNKDSVQNIFDSIMESKNNIPTFSLLDEINFADKNRAYKNLEFLRTGKSLLEKKQFDTRTIILFEKIEEQLLQFLSKSSDPDIVLENFARVIKYDNFPQIWYFEFSDKEFFNLFLLICEQAQKAIDLFAEDKVLRDNFLSRDSLISLKKIRFEDLSLKSLLFRASIQIVSKSLSAESIPKLLTHYIKQNFRKVIEEFATDKKWKSDFFIAGMGSLGSAQLSFSSDIDLIFVMRDINKFSNVQKDFQKLLQTLREYFQGFEIDCRLRPEGKNSLLVWNINDYKKYFSTRARIWELQAFTKCKLIYGDTILFDDFIQHYINIVKSKEKHQIKTEILEMRKKLLPINKDMFNVKKSSGGLMDIDFITTFLLLLNPSSLTELKDKSFFEIAEMFLKSLDKKINYKSLNQNFTFLKSTEILIQNTFNIKVARIPTEEKKLDKLSRVIGFENSELLLAKLNEVTTEVRKEYQNIFNQ